jgi:hypothetical protein
MTGQERHHMVEYLAYTVGADGHIIRLEPLACRDDGEAVSKAKRLVDDHDVEVWSGARLVIKLERKIGNSPA